MQVFSRVCKSRFVNKTYVSVPTHSFQKLFTSWAFLFPLSSRGYNAEESNRPALFDTTFDTAKPIIDLAILSLFYFGDRLFILTCKIL